MRFGCLWRNIQSLSHHFQGLIVKLIVLKHQTALFRELVREFKNFIEGKSVFHDLSQVGDVLAVLIEARFELKLRLPSRHEPVYRMPNHRSQVAGKTLNVEVCFSSPQRKKDFLNNLFRSLPAAGSLISSIV